MKLRITGNSIRLRVSPSEVERLLKNSRIEETIHFGIEEDAKLTYALEHAGHVLDMTLRRRPQEVAIVVSTKDARDWAGGEQEGLYGETGVGDTRLELAVEKDFACLDKTEGENIDTYPHPKQGASC